MKVEFRDLSPFPFDPPKMVRRLRYCEGAIERHQWDISIQMVPSIKLFGDSQYEKDNFILKNDRRNSGDRLRQKDPKNGSKSQNATLLISNRTLSLIELLSELTIHCRTRPSGGSFKA